MKTLAKLAVLLPLAAVACGGATSANSSAQAESECSMSLRANATAEEVTRAVNDVLAGVVDPCSGAVGSAGARASLERIDSHLDASGDRIVSLVFRVFRAGHSATLPQ